MLSYQGLGAGGGVGEVSGGLPLEAGVLLELLGRDCGHTQSDWRETVYQVHGGRRSLRAEQTHGWVARLVKGADIVSLASQREMSLLSELLKHQGVL